MAAKKNHNSPRRTTPKKSPLSDKANVPSTKSKCTSPQEAPTRIPISSAKEKQLSTQQRPSSPRRTSPRKGPAATYSCVQEKQLSTKQTPYSPRRSSPRKGQASTSQSVQGSPVSSSKTKGSTSPQEATGKKASSSVKEKKLSSKHKPSSPAFNFSALKGSKTFNEKYWETLRKEERSVCKVYNTEHKMIKSKVEKSQNHFDSFADKLFKKDILDDCAHNIPNSRKSKGAHDGGEYTVELKMEGESEEFKFDDWVEEHKMIREKGKVELSSSGILI